MAEVSTLQQIVFVLAITNVLTPIVFYVLAYKLGKIFVTKDDFDEMKRRVSTIDAHVLTLLQRTAHLRHDGER